MYTYIKLRVKCSFGKLSNVFGIYCKAVRPTNNMNVYV